MTNKEALKYAYDKLKETDEPKEAARFLLKQIVKKDLSFILAYPETKLSLGEERKFKRWVKKRSKHLPVWYITGYEHFCGLDFKEILVEKVLSHTCHPELVSGSPQLQDRILKQVQDDGKRGSVASGKGLTIADIGTGSGAIGISLAKNLPKAKVYLTDVSKDALKVARKNAKLNKVKNVKILQGNLLEPLPQKVDLIVANLPYVPSEDMSSLSLDILHHEPRIALEGGGDGLDLYREFFGKAPEKIKKGGKMFVEIGERQGEKMVKIVKNVFPDAKVTWEKDWAGLDRFVIVELGE